MSIEEIQIDLKRATYYNDTAEAFIPYENVREIWAGDRLERFLRTHDPNLRASEIDTARDGLLRTISILAGIAPQDWSGWSRFRTIFFPPNHALAERRRDKNTITFTKEELALDSFLGDTNLARLFTTDMWIYFPIVLNGNRQDPYENDLRLPLFQVDPVVREGGYGKVTKEMIPPKQIILSHLSDHLGIPETPHPVKLIVARKRFPKANYGVEVRQLNRLRSSLSSHKRIVSDIAIFSIRNELNIIMPWADMDLEDFLVGGYKEMQSTPCLLNNLIQESREIASAIHFLHKHLQLESEWPEFHHQAICHADLKPRNILVFKQDGSSTGIWRITDFGVSRVAHRDLSGARRHDSGYPTTADAPSPKGGAYQAPDRHAQRRSDIWSFGCILVRVFALGLDPASLPRLDEMRKEPLVGRVYDDCFHRGTPPVLNPSIEAWIQSLSPRYRASHNPAFLKEMQKVLFSMLQIDYHKRSSARELRSGLHRLHSLPIYSSPNSPFPIEITSPSSSSTPSSRSSISGDHGQQTQQESPTSSTATDKLNPITSTVAQIPHPTRLVRGVGVLVSVIKSGDINQVREILVDQIDVEQCHQGERPLIHAIEMGNAAVVDKLSIYQRERHHQNLDVRTPSSKGQTPLYLAVCKGDIDIVRAVIDADTNTGTNASPSTLVDELFNNGRTPLMEAAFLGHAGVVTLLLDRGASHRICTEQEKLNCLHFAVKQDNRAQEDVIIAFKRRMTFDQFPPDTPLDAPYETPIMLHIRRALEGQYGFLQIDSLWQRKFKALLDGGADVNRKYSPGTSLEMSSLQIAVMQTNVLMARLLVDGGATLPVSYIVPPRCSHDMKKVLKRAPRVPVASRP
ncbi:hypothetical protein N7499_012719 [Penicillium canescens]|nr:hypothetical protein N7499_012719 [Penicillium canescens]